MMQVYRITCKINGKIYIGITTVGFKARFSIYKSMVKNKKGTHHLIVQKMIQYGIENFTFEILETVLTKQELIEKEIYYIKTFNCLNPNGYNRDHGGYLPSIETLNKRSEKLKNKPLNHEHKQKISKSLIGHEVSLETRQKISNSLKGNTYNKGKKRNKPSPKKGIPASTKEKERLLKIGFQKGKTAPNKGRVRVMDIKTRKISYVYPNQDLK